MDLTQCEGRLVRLRGPSFIREPAIRVVGPARRDPDGRPRLVVQLITMDGDADLDVAANGKCLCGPGDCYADVVGFAEPDPAPVNLAALAEVLCP